MSVLSRSVGISGMQPSTKYSTIVGQWMASCLMTFAVMQVQSLYPRRTGVGTGEGIGDGTLVGTEVGTGVGIAVGTGVGTGVGTDVGTGVGTGDGSGVGTALGSMVGTGLRGRGEGLSGW